jgi:hypothetical protein
MTMVALCANSRRDKRQNRIEVTSIHLPRHETPTTYAPTGNVARASATHAVLAQSRSGYESRSTDTGAR